MKITKIFFAFFGVVAINNACSEEYLNVYNANYGSVAVYSNNLRNDVYAIGGAVPNGAATPADCFMRAQVKITKTPDVYSGNLDAVSNRVILISDSDVLGKKIFVQLMSGEVLIQRSDTNGICADGIDFTGKYTRVLPGSKDFEEIFMGLLDLQYGEALNWNKVRNFKDAIRMLQDFFYDDNYLNIHDVSDRKKYNNAENDLGFFYQENGEDSVAISHFNAVVKRDPSRTVGWLNLGDSYWNINDKGNAIRCYQEYVKLMRKSSMEKKIVARASQRISGASVN